MQGIIYIMLKVKACNQYVPYGIRFDSDYSHTPYVLDDIDLC
ncbi:MAG: hypothetical protein ACI9HU_000915 [Colwellia sp.]|jgi:hypothetical protein